MSVNVISSSQRSITYDATSATTLLVPFIVIELEDIEVTIEGDLNTDWTPSGDLINGIFENVSLTFSNAVTGEVVIRSVRVPERRTRFTQGAGIHPIALDSELDALVVNDQDLRRDLTEEQVERAQQDSILSAMLAAEAAARSSADAMINSTLARAVKTVAPIPDLQIGYDDQVLVWRAGRLINISLDAVRGPSIPSPMLYAGECIPEPKSPFIECDSEPLPEPRVVDDFSSLPTPSASLDCACVIPKAAVPEGQSIIRSTVIASWSNGGGAAINTKCQHVAIPRPVYMG